MKIFPAIDIKDKKCVRLIKGDFNNKLFMFDGFCVVNCSNFFSNFDQIVKNSFNQKSSINRKSISVDKNIVEQLEQLNSLFKSGVLTEEEFEKAKKKILN